jgi:multidrug efflux pump
MVVLMLLGVAAYFQLGQDEDPPFTFRAMVVRTYWPGATAQQVAEQVTDKLERTLQEVPFADKIRSYSKPGESQIIFQIKDSSKAADVPNVWYSVRKKIGDMKGTLPQGVHRAFLQRRVRRRVRRDLRARVRRFQLCRAQDLCRRRAPAAAARARRGQGRAVWRAGRKALHRNLAEAPGAAGTGHERRCWRSWASRTPSNRPARCRPRWTWCRCAWRASSMQSKICRAMPIRGASGNQLRLADIADIRRGYADPPSVKVRIRARK